jgi:hypothetical protein
MGAARRGHGRPALRARARDPLDRPGDDARPGGR